MCAILYIRAVWAGGWSDRRHDLINSTSGRILETISPPSGDGGGYGCLVDSDNVLWLSGGYGFYRLIRRVPGSSPVSIVMPYFVYGLGLDKGACVVVVENDCTLLVLQ